MKCYGKNDYLSPQRHHATWFEFYEQALDDGVPMFLAASTADRMLRDSIADGIDAAEGDR